jgi:hypothetical protein
MDKVHNPRISELCMPSSESFRTYFISVLRTLLHLMECAPKFYLCYRFASYHSAQTVIWSAVYKLVISRLLVGKPERKRPLGRPRRRWMDLGEVGWDGADWIGLAQDRNRWRALVNSVLNLRVPWNAGKLSSGLTSSGLSSSAQLHIVS